MRVLNRIVETHKDGVSYEADPRHVDLLAHALGLTAANSVLIPGIKKSDADYETPKRERSPEMPQGQC